MKFRLLTGVVCRGLAPLALLALALPARSAEPPGKEKAAPLKAVVHVNFADPNQQGAGLKNVANVLKEVGGAAEIEVVCHAAGIDLLVKGKSAHADQVAQLSKQGVRFRACANTMRERKLAKEDLLPGVTTVPSGAVHVLRKQQEGYAYFKP